MAKKTKRKGKVISNVLYRIGTIVIFAGTWFLKDNLLSGVYTMLAGYITMFIGWMLDAYEVGYDNDL